MQPTRFVLTNYFTEFFHFTLALAHANSVYHASPFFLISLQAEILSRESSDFLIYIIILKAFNSMLQL